MAVSEVMQGHSKQSIVFVLALISVIFDTGATVLHPILLPSGFDVQTPAYRIWCFCVLVVQMGRALLIACFAVKHGLAAWKRSTTCYVVVP